MAHDLADRVETLGEKGAKLAAELRSYGPNERIWGLEAWMGMKNWIGEDAAAQALSDIGWKAVRGPNKAHYLRLLPGGTVRDANLAKFDMSRISVADIFGGADPALLAALAGGAGLLGWGRSQGGE
jgi:hypothetical protein